MLAQVERPDIALTTSFTEADAFLMRTMEGGLPLFAMDLAGVSRQEAIERLTPTLMRHGFTLEPSESVQRVGYEGYLLDAAVEQPASTRKHEEDLGWHPDHAPRLSGPAVTSINLHATEDGTGTGMFLEPNPDNTHVQHVIDDMTIERDLLHGVVDGTIFTPRLYRVPLMAGRLVVFRSGGRLPLAHSFVTTSEQRLSYVRIAQSLRGFIPAKYAAA